MVYHRHDKSGLFTPAGHDQVAPEERRNQSSLRAVLSGGNVSDPSAAPFVSTRERILIATENPGNFVVSPGMLVMHGAAALGSAKHKIWPVVGQHPRPPRHLGLPDVVRETRVRAPIDD